jgi:hypothetical protein
VRLVEIGCGHKPRDTEDPAMVETKRKAWDQPYPRVQGGSPAHTWPPGLVGYTVVV